MARLVRPRLEAAKVFTIRHWPKMMLVVINLPMLPFWYNLPSTGSELMTLWREMKDTMMADPDIHDDPYFQNFVLIAGNVVCVMFSLLALTGADIILDIYVLLTSSIRAAKLRRALFWAFNSLFMTAKIVATVGGFTIVDGTWWFIRAIDMLDGKSPEELRLARLEFQANMTAQIAEDAKTLAMTVSGLSWGGVLRNWAWETWRNTWVQGAVIGWVLHVLIMDLQGEPRTWWGGRLQREQRDEEESGPYIPDEKMPSDRKTE